MVSMALQWCCMTLQQQALLGVMSPWALHCMALWALQGADGFVGCSGALHGFAVMCVALQQCGLAALWCLAAASTRCSVVWEGCRRHGPDLG